MTESQQDRIRRRAYEIWESEERPLGEDIRHWMQAHEELEGASKAAVGGDYASALNDAAGEAGMLEGSGDESGIIAGHGSSNSIATRDVEIRSGAKPARNTIKNTEGP